MKMICFIRLLSCLEVAISLRVMRPTSSDARFLGLVGCCH